MGCDISIYGYQPDRNARQRCLKWLDTRPPGSPIAKRPRHVSMKEIGLTLTVPRFLPAQIRQRYESVYSRYCLQQSLDSIDLDHLEMHASYSVGFDPEAGVLVSVQPDFRANTDDDPAPTLQFGVHDRFDTGNPSPYLFVDALRTHFIPEIDFGADYDVDLYTWLIDKSGLHDHIAATSIDQLNGVLEQGAQLLTRAYKKWGTLGRLDRQFRSWLSDHARKLTRLRRSPKQSRQVFIIDADVLSVRSRDVLLRGDVYTLGDLSSMTAEEIVALPNAGRTTLEEVTEALWTYKLGLRLARRRTLNRKGRGTSRTRENEQRTDEEVGGVSKHPNARDEYCVDVQIASAPLIAKEAVVRAGCLGCGYCLELLEAGADRLAKLADAHKPVSWEGYYFEVGGCPVCCIDYHNGALKHIGDLNP